jgi:hypothetical protein
MDGMTASPSCRRRRIASLAASAIEQRIRSIEKDDRVYLPKERINCLPSVPYPRTKNAIVVVSTAMESDRAVANIRAELLSTTKDEGSSNDHDGMKTLSSFHYVGLDTEARPKFHKGGKNHPTALLQIATETTACLFRLVYVRWNHYCHSGTRRCNGNFTHQSIVRPDHHQGWGGYTRRHQGTQSYIRPKYLWRWNVVPGPSPVSRTTVAGNTEGGTAESHLDGIGVSIE